MSEQSKQYVNGTYSTGEIARLCGVTVRTVQYYDKRGILCGFSRKIKKLFA